MNHDQKSNSLMHYTNYRVNPAITEAQKENIENLREKDPALYDVVGIGLPGVTSGGVYAHLLKHSSRLLQPTNTYSLGLDWGFKHDPLTIILIGTQSTHSLDTSYLNMNVLEEKQITNYSVYFHQQLSIQIVKWIRSLSYLYPKLKEEDSIVYCDKSNLTWIEMRNSTAQSLGVDWLTFLPVLQLEVELRTSFKQSLLSTKI